MKKYIAAVALLFASVAASNAAPMLGVTWRAPANAKFSGVKILSVSEGSNAQELGLEVGDFVIAINGIVVKSGAEATAEVVKAKGKLVLYMRDPKGKLYEIKRIPLSDGRRTAGRGREDQGDQIAGALSGTRPRTYRRLVPTRLL